MLHAVKCCNMTQMEIGVRPVRGWVTGHTLGEMPRAFLVKNKQPRRSTIVDNSLANMTSRDTDDRTSDQHPTQLNNCKSRCSVVEHDREKNGRTLTEFTREALAYGIRKEPRTGITFYILYMHKDSFVGQWPLNENLYSPQMVEMINNKQ